MAVFIQASLLPNYPHISPLFIFLTSDHKKQLSHLCLHVPLVNAHLPKWYSEWILSFFFFPFSSFILSLHNSFSPVAKLGTHPAGGLVRRWEVMVSSWVKRSENCYCNLQLPNPFWVSTKRFTLYLKIQADAWGADLGLETKFLICCNW